MTAAELAILLKADVQQAIEQNITRDPLAIALDKAVAHPREVSTQVKYLQRARLKLPRLYETRRRNLSHRFRQP